MSDFERIFGAGADIDSIISSINYHNSLDGNWDGDDVIENEDFEVEGTEESIRISKNLAYLEYLMSLRTRRRFSSWQEASEWSKANNGKAFTRDGDGYIELIKKQTLI